MSDINTFTDEALLMKQNRADLVKALNEIGFSKVNENTPLADIARYIRWSKGLLDIRLATFSKATFAHRYWTYDEWIGQSAQTRSSHVPMGIVIRAHGQQFIIARSNAADESGSTGIQWAPNYNNDVRGLTNFKGIPTVLEDIDGESNTDLILAAIEVNGIDYPAARLARAYRCCTRAEAGVDDPTWWSLPAIGQLWMFTRYYNEISDALSLYGMTPPHAGSSLWSSTEGDNINAWLVSMYYLAVRPGAKHEANGVRPVAKVQPDAVESAPLPL